GGARRPGHVRRERHHRGGRRLSCRGRGPATARRQDPLPRARARRQEGRQARQGDLPLPLRRARRPRQFRRHLQRLRRALPPRGREALMPLPKWTNLGDPNDPNGFLALAERFYSGLRALHFSERTILSLVLYLRPFFAFCVERAVTRPSEVT